MEKVAEQRILQKCFKCSRFGVMSTLLEVATIAITHLAMDLGLKTQHQTRPLLRYVLFKKNWLSAILLAIIRIYSFSVGE